MPEDVATATKGKSQSNYEAFSNALKGLLSISQATAMEWTWKELDDCVSSVNDMLNTLQSERSRRLDPKGYQSSSQKATGNDL